MGESEESPTPPGSAAARKAWATRDREAGEKHSEEILQEASRDLEEAQRKYKAAKVLVRAFRRLKEDAKKPAILTVLVLMFSHLSVAASGGQELVAAQRSPAEFYRLEYHCAPSGVHPSSFHGRGGARWWRLSGPTRVRDDGALVWAESPRFWVTADMLTIESDGSVKNSNSRWSFSLPGNGRMDSRSLAMFSEDNTEGLVKILPAPPDHRRFGGDHWLVASFATDVTVYLYVYDRKTGAYVTFVKQIGPAVALIDTTTFHDRSC